MSGAADRDEGKGRVYRFTEAVAAKVRGAEPRDLALDVVIAVSLIIFLVLRLRNLGHILIWDEAQLALTVRSFTGGIHDGYRALVNTHPPLYMLLASFLHKAFKTNAVSYEVLSLLFSLGTFVVTYFIAKTLFRKTVATFTLFFLALLPASVSIDTWVKQDAMTGFFMTLTLLLFLKKRYVWAGVVFGLGMLTKETAVFAAVIIVIYALVCWSRERAKGALCVVVIGAAMSFWWYLWVSTRVGYFWSFFRGTNPESLEFGGPWYHYFRGLPEDLGWVPFVLMVAGLCLCVYRAVKGNRDALFPVIWMISIYAFYSLSAGKPFWMVYGALPAAAMLSGVTLGGAVDYGLSMSGRRRARYAILAGVGVVVLACIVLASLTTYTSYMRSRDLSSYGYAQELHKDAQTLSKRLNPGEKVFMLSMDRAGRLPVFEYYTGPERIERLDRGILKKADEFVDLARKEKARWLYLNYTEAGLQGEKSVLSFFERVGAAAFYEIIRQREGFAIVRFDIPGT